MVGIDKKRLEALLKALPTVTYDEIFPTKVDTSHKEELVDQYTSASTSKPVPKFTKTDLSYMLKWDPTSIRKKMDKKATNEKQIQNTKPQ
eukprot:8682693-Ditylum_brightwellii.AAC.1